MLKSLLIAIDMENLKNSLIITGVGMLGVFLVIGIIFGVMLILNSLSNKRSKKDNG